MPIAAIHVGPIVFMSYCLTMLVVENTQTEVMYCNQSQIEMEAEIAKLKRQIETLESEKAELREMNEKLKQSLDEAVRGCLRPKPHSSELQRQLTEANQQLSDKKKEMSNIQDRLTVSEQVTAATQRRQLIQEGVYENLPTTGAYGILRLDPTPQENVNATSPSPPPAYVAGCVIVLRSNRTREAL